MKKALSKSKKLKKTKGIPLAVATVNGGVCMLERIDAKTGSSLFLSWSIDGLEFVSDGKEVSIKTAGGKKEKIENCEKFSISRTPNGYVMTFQRKGTGKKKNILVIARSSDLYSWTEKSEMPADDFNNTTISYRKEKDEFDLYKDGLFIRHQSSKTLSVWREKPTLMFTSRNNNFDAEKLSIIGSIATSDGTLLMYDASIEKESKVLLQAGAVIFDKNNPKHIVWRSPKPIWQGVLHAKEKSLPVRPLGFVSFLDHYLIYWLTAVNDIVVTTIPALFKEIEEAKYHPKILDRFHNNPILSPRKDHDWEGEGTFNPAVVEDDEGVIHVLYRAVGRDGISRVGHAKSLDGKYFEKRSAFPVFEPGMGFGMPNPKEVKGPVGYHPAIYTSGGGWGGSEDPRAVIMNKKVYMMYVAFEGWDSVRIALTSITLKDFKEGKWKWKKPVHLSPPGQVHKNWLLFPEKINGKYAILHSIVPKICVDYIDDIDKVEEFIESPRKFGPQPGRKNCWDSIMRGAGPPPIKTELGWLVLYHAIEKQEFHRYKLGAMILDKKDPTKILYRSKHPILSPDMHYENNGKPGVIYASGALIRGDDLYIYYGGADKVVCVATTRLDQFLNYLINGKTKPYELKKV